jgi:hypothetical protein
MKRVSCYGQHSFMQRHKTSEREIEKQRVRAIERAQ